MRDLAAFAFTKDGVDEMCIAVVPGAGFDQEALRAAYVRAFPRCPVPRVVRVDAIPRNEMGKVQRKQLRAAVPEGTTAP